MRKQSKEKMRRFLAGAIAGSAAVMAAHKALAKEIVQDGFNYTTPGNLPGQVNPYENQTWALTGVQTLSGPAIISGNLSYPTSNAPAQLGGNTVNLINQSSAPRLNLGNPTVAYKQTTNPGQTLYYSMLLDVTNATGLLTGTGGGFLAGFNNLTGTQNGELTGAAASLLIRKDNTSDTTYHLGISQVAAGNRTFDNTTSYAQGQTLFLVAAYNFGATAGTDTANLWVYPSGAVPTTPGTPTISAPYFGEISGTVDALTSVFLRDNAGGTGTQISVDDLRVSTDWSSVVFQPGDANGDGKVDSADFDILAGNFGQTTGLSWSQGDFNGDGIVNALDFNTIATNYGFGVSAAALPGSVVPEPSSLLLLFAGASALLTKRR